ncbi:MAG TPA: hypothetical protein PKK06_10965 [Phycisphaerae bacterium]|nr:hypothetical protein [Phycisphaerae bacterium]HNU44336.1 hypothetical protein [Phycisphaerae bacterium]
MVEVTVSLVVVGVALVAVLNTVGAARMGLKRIGDRSRAVLLAQDLMTEILQQAYEDPSLPVGSFGLEADEVGTGTRALWDDVDDYHGWQSAPPRDKSGNPLTGFERWRRHVAVGWVQPANPVSTTIGDSRVKRITVTVSRDGVVLAVLQSLKGGAQTVTMLNGSPTLMTDLTAAVFTPVTGSTLKLAKGLTGR